MTQRNTVETEPSGVLIVNKHKGVTSHDIVNKIRRLYHTRRVGHTGTLDPMATGVLVVLIGRAAKAAEYLSHDEKCYRAHLRLGMTTDSEDVTGTILTQTDQIPPFSALTEILPSFRGTIQQVPPMYSALKVGGKKLVDLAREGKTVERQPRAVEIFALNAAPLPDTTDILLEVHCSGGTYIRTLCADLGAALGCGGVMAELERTMACGFHLSQGHTIDELEKMTDEERAALLIPTEALFQGVPALKLPAFYEKLCRSGCEIYLSKLRATLCEGDRVRLCDEKGEFFALGEVFLYPDGLAVKAIKTFVL